MALKIGIARQKELENYLSPKLQSGSRLPNPKSVSDGTPFYLQASDGVYTEHLMFNGRWHRKIIDSNSQVILDEV